MTLCIAATCHAGGAIPTPQRKAGNAAIVAWDKRIFRGHSTAETGRKFLPLNPRWCALIAGPLSAAKELAFACKSAVADEETLHEGNLPGRIRRAVRRYTVNEYLVKHYGVQYDEFLKNGRERFGPALREIFAELRDLEPPQVQIVFCGWLFHREAFILARYSYGEIEVEEHFALIGSGEETAQLMLFLRNPTGFMTIEQAVYTVYEAQRVGALARDVGFNTISKVLEYDLAKGHVVSRNVKGPVHGFLDRTFRKLGPKALPDNFELEDDVLEGEYHEQPLIRPPRIRRRNETPSMAKPSKSRDANPPASGAGGSRPRPPGDAGSSFDRLASAIFQVPKDEIAPSAPPKKRAPKRKD